MSPIWFRDTRGPRKGRGSLNTPRKFLAYFFTEPWIEYDFSISKIVNSLYSCPICCLTHCHASSTYRSIPVCSRYPNSLRPCDTYMRQWYRAPLVQIMTCCLVGATPLPKPMNYCQRGPRNKFHRKSNQNPNIFIQKPFEDIRIFPSFHEFISMISDVYHLW